MATTDVVVSRLLVLVLVLVQAAVSSASAAAPGWLDVVSGGAGSQAVRCALT